MVESREVDRWVEEGWGHCYRLVASAEVDRVALFLLRVKEPRGAGFVILAELVVWRWLLWVSLGDLVVEDEEGGRTIEDVDGTTRWSENR